MPQKSGPHKKVNWIIDESMGLVQDSFYDVAAANGYNVVKLNSAKTEYLISGLDGLFGPKECVVFMGSISGATAANKQPWLPGSYRNLERLQCTNYYPTLNKESLLLNSRYFLLPLGDIPAAKDLIRKNFCISRDRIFIRPNKCNKIFSGQTIDSEFLENEIELLKKTYKVDDEELCLISSDKKYLIDYEYRFVVAGGKVIAGSQYFPELKTIKYRHPAFYWAYTKAATYEPDSVYTMDVCLLSNGEYKIIELNSFSCAGLYKCDSKDVLTGVSIQALKEWKDVFNC